MNSVCPFTKEECLHDCDRDQWECFEQDLAASTELEQQEMEWSGRFEEEDDDG